MSGRYITSISCFLLAFILIIINCAPVPMIQSARITGRAGLGFDYSSDSYYVKYKDRDTIQPESYPNSVFRGLEDTYTTISQDFNTRAYLRFAIKKRVELIATITPNIYFPIAACGNIKIALFDIGSEKLFHNISGAVFAGGTLLSGDWSDYTDQWGGFVTGTHTLVKSMDIELVMMTSLSHFNYYQSSENYGNKDVRFLIASLSPGVIVRPFKRHWLEMNLGCALRHPISSYTGTDDYYHNLASSEVVKSKMNPLVFQFGMLICIPDKKSKTAN